MRPLPAETPATTPPRRIAIVRDQPLASDVEAALRRDWMVLEYVARLDEITGIKEVDAVLFGSCNGAEAVISAAQRLRQANPHCLRIYVHEDDVPLAPLLYDTVHQVVPRAGAIDALAATLERCFRLRDALSQSHADDALSGLESLPSLPHVYHEFVNASQCEAVDFGELADIVEHDLALTARILGLANSAHFGLPQSVTTIKQAISVLGIDMLSTLVTATSLFGALADGKSARRLEQLWMHGSNVSQLALALSLSEGRLSLTDRAEVTLTGLLHDIGQLVIMTRMPQVHARIDQTSLHDGEAACAVERREIGATHSEIGACLLAYWGISPRTVDGVALHHDIRAASQHTDPAIWSVFAANALLAQPDGMTASYRHSETPGEDELEVFFGADRVGKWRFAYASFLGA